MDLNGVRLRAVTADDADAVTDLLARLFHHTPGPAERAVERSVSEPDRALVAEDDGVVAGHAAAFTRELTVPGAVLPAAFVSQVGVAPTHRRRGLLTALMGRQLGELAAAGREPVAVLWASEGAIYPRYGYGLAAHRLMLEAAIRDIRPPQAPAVRLRLARPGDVRAELARVYDALRPHRTGWAGRDERWWGYVLSDLPEHRDGGTELHAALAEGPHGPTGYALWRTRSGWDETGPKAHVLVREVAAADPAAYAALWRLLLTTDLARTLGYPFAALDEPLLHLVDEPRRLGGRLLDALWVRVVDVGAALAARRYAVDVDVVLDVTDPLLPANTGRWRLTGGPGGAACARTGDPADLACTVTELGAVYLGGPALAALAAGGRVRELTAGALDRASAAFGWHRLPTATEVF